MRRSVDVGGLLLSLRVAAVVMIFGR